MDMLRVTANWSGFPGAPGYSNFFFAGGGGLISDAQQVADRTAAALLELQFSLPADVTITVVPEVAIIDSDTGVLSEYIDITPPEPFSGNQGGSYSGPTGAVVNWTTQDVRFGRRIRGRTFIVPLSNTSYDDDGTLDSDTLSNLQSFANTLVGGDFDSEFGVWSRPRNGSGGVFASATGFRVPDMAAVLRSRRD